MPEMFQRIQELTKTRKERSIPFALKKYQEELRGGGWIFDLAHEYRFLAVADYLASKEVKIFRGHLQTSTKYSIELFERTVCGEQISESFLDINNFKELFTALASGSFKITQELATHLSKISINPKSTYAGYFLKLQLGFILPDYPVDFEAVLKKMQETFIKRYKSWTGYPLCFAAIYHKNKTGFLAAFDILIKGHKILCRAGNDFGDTEDEVIAIWPLAMVNLARFKGLDVVVDHPLVPKELLCDVL